MLSGSTLLNFRRAVAEQEHYSPAEMLVISPLGELVPRGYLIGYPLRTLCNPRSLSFDPPHTLKKIKTTFGAACIRLISPINQTGLLGKIGRRQQMAKIKKVENITRFHRYFKCDC